MAKKNKKKKTTQAKDTSEEKKVVNKPEVPEEKDNEEGSPKKTTAKEIQANAGDATTGEITGAVENIFTGEQPVGTESPADDTDLVHDEQPVGAEDIAATADLKQDEQPEVDKAFVDNSDLLPDDELIIELCGPGKRCKQRPDGRFIRQNFISGRWVQVGGTVFPSLASCKKACES